MGRDRKLSKREKALNFKIAPLENKIKN